MRMLKKGWLCLAVVMVLATGLASAGWIAADRDGTPGGSIVPDKGCAGAGCLSRPNPLYLHDAMRQVWIEHNVWSRMVLMGIVDSMKGCEFYEDRAHQSIKDMEDLLVPYFGDDTQKFGLLLEQHFEIEDRILYSVRDDDQTFRSLIPDWYRNAEEISDLLYTLNPGAWNRDEMDQMWRVHIDMSIDQAFAYKKGDWQSDITAFDFLQDHTLQMADYLSRGLVLPNPTK